MAWLMCGAAVLASPATAATPASTSVFVQQPQDGIGVVVDAPKDGRGDAGPAIQAAIDRAYAQGKNQGIVFLPAGRYRISKTLYIWPAVRVFGVGKTRPVIVLGDNTPGFDKGVKNMVIFAGGNPTSAGDAPRRVPFPPPGSVPFNEKIADANPGTFYPAISNVDFEIGKGNPAATAIRFHAAQHAYLSHIDFHIGSGLAGIYHVANEAEDLRFFGGRYGILAEKPSPAWQFTLIDSVFEGQREAAIREHEASLTLINTRIRNVPVGIDIDEGYSDWLWGKNVRFENVSKAAVVISNENNPYTQIGFENALATATPTFARFRESGKTVAGAGKAYRMKAFNYGMFVPSLGATGKYDMKVDAQALSALPAPGPRAVRLLPATSEWVNVKTLGVVGDDKADDTAAIQKAIDTHKVLYFPSGHYRVTDTLKLKPDTVLIGLHPGMTWLSLPDKTPGFAGVGAPKALVESAKGGDAIVSGLGLFTGGINPRATGLLWKAGENSLVQDVKFQGGHGTILPDGTRMNPYDATRMADPDPAKRWAGQYPSLWVTDGGGGTFTNVWTVDTYAQSGLYVSDTKTPGHVYQMSAEHHGPVEIAFNRVENWELLAPQTEEEAGESQDAVSLEIRNSSNILVANYHAYRVTRTFKPVRSAVRLFNSGDIRFRNMHVNGESGVGMCDENGCTTYLRLSKFPYENAIHDLTSKLEVREREFAVLDIPPLATPAPVVTADAAAVLAPGAKVEKLEGDFYSVSGGAVDANGKLYFVDHRKQTIYGWSKDEGLSVERDNATDPVSLAVDKSGNLLVLSSLGRNGTVYSFKPGSPETEMTLIQPTPVGQHAGAATVLPLNFWNNGEFKDQVDPETYRFTTLAEMFARDIAVPRPTEYVSPDGSIALPAYRVIQQGPPDHRGLRFSDSLDTYGFTLAQPGQRVFVSNNSESKVYSGLLGAGGAITDLKMFANRGGESLAVDDAGNVYVANGQVFVYDPQGKEIGRIDTPERPLQLLIGGKDRKTLFILSHHSLHGVALK
ncbi:SMP-30/gluconolactonase/LRE family protein [Sphingomonas sp. XMGL2]|uniref:SMP-30/gluconolactonase/LRE family protein n=2 Tax=Sphingomonas quercus TaxID=2842451 RepID=A0ABS6BMD9_9SPHN|nr:SMP-30/gluconolactonase/LRE family protein [Sphingomonas quercus]